MVTAVMQKEENKKTPLRGLFIPEREQRIVI